MRPKIRENLRTANFFFFRVTLVTIAIMFHNHILILTLRASLLRFEFRFAGQLSLAFEFRFERQLCR